MKFKENAILTFLNDKAMVPVGEPLHAVSTNIRKHNRSLGIENVFTEALDHDWKVCGLVQSVVLVCDIPDSIKSSFMTGTPNITTKEKVLEKSDPFRHATELANIFRANYSTDEISRDKQILLMYLDGGADHNVNFNSTKISLFSLFLQLDLNMLVALRCCPTQNWVNPAERVISLLNLALQNCALERTKMADTFEAKMKNIKNIYHLWNSADRMKGLKAAFTESMSPVITLVNSRFEATKLKDELVRSKNAASDEESEWLKDSVYLINNTTDFTKLIEVELKEKMIFPPSLRYTVNQNAMGFK